MAEMLTVIIVMGILAASAAPLFADMMRDRRVNRAAMEIADTLRTARARAMGRGLPVLVRWDRNAGSQVGSSGLLSVREPRVVSVAQSPSCFSTVWTDATATQEVMRFDIGNGAYERADAKFFDAANAQRDFAEICFNARGHTYYRTAGAFTLLVGVPRFQIENSIAKGGTGLSRTVIVPPNGAARFTQ